jgi:hypothetical protein
MSLDLGGVSPFVVLHRFGRFGALWAIISCCRTVAMSQVRPEGPSPVLCCIQDVLALRLSWSQPR